MSDAPDQPTSDTITTGQTDEEDGVTTLSGGRLRFVVDGRRYNLRQPRLREFRRLRKAVLSIDKNLSEDEQFDAMEAWIIDVFKTLADRELGPSDDWPAWMCGGTIQAKLLIHWRDVPINTGE